MSPPAQRKADFKTLRTAYDLAFQQLAFEVQNLIQAKVQNGVESGKISQLEEQISAANRCYLRRRNELADFLLSRRAEGRTMRSATATVSDRREVLSVEKHAYFLWENSGRPGGNDQANWYDAETQCR